MTLSVWVKMPELEREAETALMLRLARVMVLVMGLWSVTVLGRRAKQESEP